MNIKKSSTIWEISAISGLLALGTGITLFSLANKKLQNTIIETAKQYIGIKEIGDDDDEAFSDPTFQYKMQHIGWYSGLDWCAFFVKLVLLESFSKLKLPEHYNYVKQYFSPATQRTWAAFRANPNPKVFKLSAKPEKGSVALWRNIKNSSFGHTGIVVKVQGKNFKTIEGNRQDDVGYMDRTLTAYTRPQGRLQLLGFIVFKS